MNKKRKWLAGLLLAALSHGVSATPSPYRIETAPSWVIEAPDASLLVEGTPVEVGQVDYPLIDHQVRVAEQTSHYRRFVERLTSQAAVDRSAQISIEMDPQREVVLLHKVRIFRDGRAIDKLANSRRSLLSREEGLEHRLINGRVTLHVLLQDVRVGDVLDFSFSTVRSDPPDERQYYEWFTTQWASPTRDLRLRLLRPANRDLHIQDQGGLPAPHEIRRAGWVDTTWEGRDIPALPDEDSRPRWHVRYPHIQISEFGSWDEVRQWTQPRYRIPAPHDAAFDALLSEIRSEPGTADRILRALRFVQDDIRYTGIEIGAGAWTPAQPATVLARRYGDCKDKVLLLVAALRAIGIEAEPALVNSEMGRTVPEWLPNPGAFNHAVAKVHWNQRDYWLDATVSGQGGTLDTLVQADFGPALVLAPNASGLEDMPSRDGHTPSDSVVETYDFSHGTASTAPFSVHTEYRDEEADAMRVKLRSQTAAELGKSYLDYYRRSYSGIRMLRVPKIVDDRVGNRLAIDERYEIDRPFETATDKTRTFYLEAFLITDRSSKPTETVRTSPLARGYPMHVHHEVVAYLPKNWNFRDDHVQIVDKSFEYESSAHFNNDTLDLDYDLRNTRDHVPVADLEEFLAKLAKVHDDAFFTLSEGRPAATNEEQAAPASASGESGIVFVVGLLAGAGLGAWLAMYFWRLDLPTTPAEPGAPVGIEGWLVLPALQAIIGPPVLLYLGYEWIANLGPDAVFRNLASTVKYLSFTVVLLVAAMFALSIAQLALLFMKRNSFPRLFVVVKASHLVLHGLLVATLICGKVTDKSMADEMRALISVLVSVAIWVPYILLSTRVRATFTAGPDRGMSYRRPQIPRVLGAE